MDPGDITDAPRLSGKVLILRLKNSFASHKKIMYFSLRMHSGGKNPEQT
jgi:hypothetical protein